MRFDYIFSYWIFLWWMLYQMKWVNANPKFMIIIALVYICFVLVIKSDTKRCRIFPFLLSIIIIKLIPLYTLRNTTVVQSDIYYTLLIFLLYVVWVVLNDDVQYVYDFYALSLRDTSPPFEYVYMKFFDTECLLPN
jgi:hypothetical protein